MLLLVSVHPKCMFGANHYRSHLIPTELHRQRLEAGIGCPTDRTVVHSKTFEAVAWKVGSRNMISDIGVLPSAMLVRCESGDLLCRSRSSATELRHKLRDR
ncbi:hypothetical protein BH10ACT9_BH10ACT9_45930 [soil metagenome]